MANGTENNKGSSGPPKLRTNKVGQPVRPDSKSHLTMGQKASDVLTNLLGSWTFLLGISIILVLWVSANVVEFIWRPWDPYPFILLNFVLSTLAAIQAPIILMSQNRSSETDRMRQEYDYLINRKAEREIQAIQKDVLSIKNYMQKVHKLSKEIKGQTDNS